MKKYLDFSQEFGKIDEELIAEAGKPWTIKRGDVFRLYRRKIGVIFKIQPIGVYILP